MIAIFFNPGCGKTTLITDIIRQFDHCTTGNSGGQPLVIYCYLHSPPQLKNQLGSSTKVLYHKGLPNIKRLLNLHRQAGSHILLVWDDLALSMQQLTGKETSQYMSLITEVSRKSKISIISVFQELFPQSGLGRIIIKNSSSLVIFKFPTDNLSMSNFLKRLYPNAKEHKEKLEALRFVAGLKPAGGYLFIDTSERGDDQCGEIKCRSFVCAVPNNHGNKVHGSRVCDLRHLYLFPENQM